VFTYNHRASWLWPCMAWSSASCSIWAWSVWSMAWRWMCFSTMRACSSVLMLAAMMPKLVKTGNTLPSCFNAAKSCWPLLTVSFVFSVAGWLSVLTLTTTRYVLSIMIAFALVCGVPFNLIASLLVKGKGSNDC